MQYKDGRIVLPIVEFSISGNTYNVNGINLSYAVFFVKKDRKKFVLLQPAEYHIQTVGANVNLVIQDSVLDNVVAIQVALNITKISSDYNVFGTPDITILKDKYNQLEKDMTNLWEYIEKQGVTSDVMNVDIVLPSIAEGETYIMRNGSIEATPLISAEDELQKLLDKLVENSQGILDGYVELLKNDIENQTKIFFEENKKEFLNKTEVRKEISYASGTEYKGNNNFGTELKSITEGETYYYNTKPYMAIKTELNLSGFIAPDDLNFADITNKNLNSILSENSINIVATDSNNNPATTWKFMRFGKMVFFSINYYFSTPVQFPSLADIADYPKFFEPSPLFYNSHYEITNSGVVCGANLLIKQQRIYLVGHDTNKAINALRGTIVYMTE